MSMGKDSSSDSTATQGPTLVKEGQEAMASRSMMPRVMRNGSNYFFI